jgi:ubiquinone/menaquinone biosynthesis C-methylase UbiE
VLEQDGSVSRLYDAWSATYDEDANRTRDLAGRVLREARLRGLTGDVVELGCGPGENTVWLAERARSLVAVDFSEGMLSRARAKVPAANVAFLAHDLLQPLPLPEGSADLVALVLVLEHLPAVAPVMTAPARVLRPGGELFVCEYHPFRQLTGGQARFHRPGSEQPVKIPAYLHMLSEFVNAGLGAGLTLNGLDERFDVEPPQEGTLPRVLALTFRKPASGHD